MQKTIAHVNNSKILENIATSADFIYALIKSVNETIPRPYHVVINGLDMNESIDIAASNYDGIILVSQMDDNWFINKVIDEEIPIVVINRKLDKDIPVSNIYCNYLCFRCYGNWTYA